MDLQWRSSKALIVSVVTLGIFTDTAVYSILIPLLPDLISKFGGDAKDLGVLLALYAVGSLTFSPLFGIVSDRLNNRMIPMILSLLSLIGSSVLFMLASSYWMLYLARFLQGVSGGAVWTLGMTLIADTHEREEMGSAMGLAMSGFLLGELAGPPIGGVLYQHFGYSAPFLFCIALIALDLAGRLLVIEKTPSAESSLSITTVTDAKSGPQAKSPNTIIDLLRMPSIQIIGILMIVTGIASTSLEIVLPLHLNAQFGYNSEQVGLIFIALILPGALLSPVAGYCNDKIGFKVVLIGIPLSCATALAFAFLGSSIISLIILLIVFAGALCFAITPLFAELSACVPNTMYARIYGINNICFSLGMLFGPMLGSVIYQVGGWLWASIFVAIILTLCIPVVLIYKRPS